MELKDRELSSRVINSAIKVHQNLGVGFLESIYEKALCIELDSVCVSYEQQKSVQLIYRGNPIGEHRLDLLVEGRLVVELKSARHLEPIHFATVRSYLKATNLDSGLLLNFGAIPLDIKRVGRELTSFSSR
jgi:GxxExxY protein